MNIYYLHQNTWNDYDTYDSAVVIAETEEQAKRMHPHGGDISQEEANRYKDWPSDPEEITCKFLGVAEGISESYVVCASYNAG